MVLRGVDIVEGKPRKWLVENSWGKDKGKQGTWTLYADKEEATLEMGEVRI